MNDSKHSVKERYDAGEPLGDIADDLGMSNQEVAQRYRDQAYDHWDTGWSLEGNNGQGRFTSGAVDVWQDGDASVEIEELHGEVPLTIIVEDEEVRTLAHAGLDAEQARDLAQVLEECAEILESER